MRFFVPCVVLATAAFALPSLALAQQGTRDGNWQGVYIGGHVGGAFGSAASRSTSGYVAGGQIGVNGQFDKIVLGVEADVSATSNGSSGFGNKFRQGTNGSMRARAGYSFGRVLVYGTGGIAVSNYSYTSTVSNTSRMRTGTVIGAGAELMLTDHISVRGELLRYDYSKSNLLTATGLTNVTPKSNVVRGGMNYRF